jgi:hypothetical protein
MNLPGEHRTLSQWLVVSFGLVLGICEVARCEGMNLSISFQSSYEKSCAFPPDCTEVLGEFRVNVRWTVVPAGTLGYTLLADGQQINIAGKNSTSCSGRVIYEFFPSLEAFDAAIEQYLNQRHTYTVVARFYDPSSGDWKSVPDAYVYEGPDILQIENRVIGFLENECRPVQIRHVQKATEGFDPDYDMPYVTDARWRSADIFSFLPGGQGQSERRLHVDSRPKGSASDVDLWLQLVAFSETPFEFPSAVGNELRFSIPSADRGYSFGSACITIQPYDPFRRDVTYPRWDVRRIIEQNAGIFPLSDLQGSYDSGVPYAFFTLNISKRIWGDFNGDGAVDLRDFSILAAGWRKRGLSSLDIAGHGAAGWPDGNVNASDLQMLCRNWVGTTQWPKEGFESGSFKSFPWSHSGNASWRIAPSDHHMGLYCAQAGLIGDRQASILTVKLKCSEGQISFWRKVSSQSEKDVLKFRIGETVQSSWSGELDWEKVSFPIQAGEQTFSWIYSKDSWDSRGQDTAWIDDITFPPR